MVSSGGVLGLIDQVNPYVPYLGLILTATTAVASCWIAYRIGKWQKAASEADTRLQTQLVSNSEFVVREEILRAIPQTRQVEHLDSLFRKGQSISDDFEQIPKAYFCNPAIALPNILNWPGIAVAQAVVDTFDRRYEERQIKGDLRNIAGFAEICSDQDVDIYQIGRVVAQQSFDKEAFLSGFEIRRFVGQRSNPDVACSLAEGFFDELTGIHKKNDERHLAAEVLWGVVTGILDAMSNKQFEHRHRYQMAQHLYCLIYKNCLNQLANWINEYTVTNEECLAEVCQLVAEVIDVDNHMADHIGSSLHTVLGGFDSVNSEVAKEVRESFGQIDSFFGSRSSTSILIKRSWPSLCEQVDRLCPTS